MLTSLIENIQRLCPELLLSDRMHQLRQNNNKIEDNINNNISINSNNFSDLEIVWKFYLHCDKTNKNEGIKLLKKVNDKEIIKFIQDLLIPSIVKATILNDDYSEINENLKNISCIRFYPNNDSTCDIYDSEYCNFLWSIWKEIHSFYSIPQIIELITFNSLFDCCNKPAIRLITSYNKLLEEPIIFSKLPITLLKSPIIIRIITTVLKSLLVASQASVIESLKVKRKTSENISNIKGAKLLSNSDSIKNIKGDYYRDLQEIIVVRILLELWSEFNIIYSNANSIINVHKYSLILNEIREIISEFFEWVIFNNNRILISLLHFGLNEEGFDLLSGKESIALLLGQNICNVVNSMIDVQNQLLSINTTGYESILRHVLFLITYRPHDNAVSDLLSLLLPLIIKINLSLNPFMQTTERQNIDLYSEKILSRLIIEIPSILLELNDIIEDKSKNLQSVLQSNYEDGRRLKKLKGIINQLLKQIDNNNDKIKNDIEIVHEKPSIDNESDTKKMKL
jgi:hypothetical protein